MGWAVTLIGLQGYFYQISKGGGGIWDFGPFLNKFRTFWNFFIVDLSVYAAWLRGPDISQNIQNIFKKYPKIDYRAFASNRRHYAADNRTARDIQNCGPFWVVKIQGGGAMPPPPPGPPDKNIPGLCLPGYCRNVGLPWVLPWIFCKYRDDRECGGWKLGTVWSRLGTVRHIR